MILVEPARLRRGSIKSRVKLNEKIINKAVLGINKTCYQVNNHKK